MVGRTVTTPTRGAKGGVLGRPRINPPDDAAERIEKLAASHYSMIGIARKFDVSVDTLREWFEDHQELKAAFQAGRAKEERRLVGLMAKIAENQEDLSAAVKAASYLLSTRHNYRDGTGGGSGESNVRVVVELPAAASVEEYRAGRGKVIDHE